MPVEESKNNTLENSPSITVLLCNILCFCIFIVALLITFHDRSWMHNAFTYLSYYIILGLCVTWGLCVFNLYQYKKSNAFVFLRRNWKGILASFILTSLVFISVPKYFRVLSDETNLLSVARSMTFNKTVENTTESRRYYEMFWPTPTSGTEKRPFLFPFFTSLLHTLLGYHIENVFILNYFALWVMLFLLYFVIQTSLGDLGAISGLILVMAQPFISLSAASGSFEIFNFLFILGSFLALKCFLDDPRHQTFINLLMTLLMLANVRYESALFLIIALLVIAVAGYVKPKFFSQSFAYALIPFFLLPLIWQRVLLASESDSNLIGGSWVNAFQFANAQHNIVLFFKYILDAGGQLGYAGIVNIIGILAIVLCGILWSTKKREAINKNALVLWICSVSSLLVLFAVVISYQGGINDHPLNGRFYIPVLVPLTLAPVFLLAHLVKDQKKLGVLALVLALTAFAIYHPIAVEDRLTNNLMIIREYRYVDDFLKKNADKNTLIVCGRPGQLIVSNYGAISYSTANDQADTILQQFKNHLFSKIYVVQSIAYATNTPFGDNIVDPRYSLEIVSEQQSTGVYFFRISRVKVPE